MRFDIKSRSIPLVFVTSVVRHTAAMKLSTLGINLAFAISAFALPSLLSSSATNRPACSYPIGKAGGANAKVSGRLFEIDGKIEYFAGLFVPKIPFAVAELSKEVMHGGWHI